RPLQGLPDELAAALGLLERLGELDHARQELVHALCLLEGLVGLTAHHLELLARDLHQVVGLVDASLHRSRQVDGRPRHREGQGDDLPDHATQGNEGAGGRSEVVTSLCIVMVCALSGAYSAFYVPIAAPWSAPWGSPGSRWG